MGILNWPMWVIQRLVFVLLRTYKWLELQLFRVATPILHFFGANLVSGIGVVLHFTEEGDVYSEETWTPAQEAAALSKCAPKYQSVIHVQIEDKREFYARTANAWGLGFGETYMEGVWDAPHGHEHITQFVARFMENNLLKYYLHPWNLFLNYVEFSLFNLQSRTQSYEVMKTHYDLGNDLYEAMLCPMLQYTCGYWKDAKNLDEAQLHKMDLVARKLDLKPGMRVLELGCGWGTLSKFLAEKYGVECVAVNISKEQVAYAREKCKGLKVEFRLQDYRDVDEKEKFDRVVSVGMMEHVGHWNYDEFFRVAHRNLKDDGIFVLHTIALNHADDPRAEPWLDKYFFPNGMLPFPNDITKYSYGKFIIEDWHNFGWDYVETLSAWRENFIKNWPSIQDKYDKKMYRMWIFYLSMTTGVFQARRTQLWQIVLTKEGLKREYRAAR